MCSDAERALIEAEATAAAEQRLRERIEREPMYDENDRITAMNGTVREPRTMADATEAYRARVLALFSDAPPPASPRQGEPVDVNIRRKPIPASVVRLMRIEQRPAGRGTIIVHEIDEVHPNTEACDICQLVTGAALSEPAES